MPTWYDYYLTRQSMLHHRTVAAWLCMEKVYTYGRRLFGTYLG